VQARPHGLPIRRRLSPHGRGCTTSRQLRHSILRHEDDRLSVLGSEAVPQLGLPVLLGLGGAVLLVSLVKEERNGGDK
jgi:hypothetical protein